MTKKYDTAKQATDEKKYGTAKQAIDDKKNTVQPNKQQMTIRHVSTVCWISKATDVYS
jgi:hypothetical protein